MPRTRAPYPAEFGQQMIERVRAGKTPAQLSREFECSAQSIIDRVAQAAIDEDKPVPSKHGLSGAEREELNRLRRENRQLELERDILSKATAWFAARGEEDVHAVFDLVNANQAALPVRTMCRLFDVSATELLDQGTTISRRRVARLMRCAHIRGVSRRRGFIVTTQRDKEQRPAPDRVNRQFVADGPNRLWVADMTYGPTWAGFIFLAVVLDVWSRRVVGWAIGETMTGELVLAALNMALEQRKPRDVVHHSDQGSQYTALEFGKRCKLMGVRPSMGSVGDAYDNAMAESFFASLQCELIDRHVWPTKTEARLALFSYIEGCSTRAGATVRSPTCPRSTSKGAITQKPNRHHRARNTT